jgi:hypothetical protein
MDNQKYTLFTLAERPDLVENVQRLHTNGWAKFMLYDEVASLYFGEMLNKFPELQLVLVNKENEAVACANAVSFLWNGLLEDLPEGWDDVLRRSVNEHQRGIVPNTVSAIAIVINPAFRGHNLSEVMVKEMKRNAKYLGIEYMVAPVRPSMKSKYPLISMEKYANWKNQNGLPFDPWLRVHFRSGADILIVAKESMVIKGTVKDWESWTGIQFPESGHYTIPDGLVPIKVSIEEDYGLYIEPNVWMRHYL